MKTATPPGILEWIVRRLLPRAWREPMLGDLHERYRSPWQYAADGAVAIAAAVVSQIRRVTPGRFLLLEALAVYASFFGTAWWARGAFYGAADAGQIARLTLLVMAGLLWRDAYAGHTPKRHSVLWIAMVKRSARPLTARRLRLLRGIQVAGSTYLAVFFSVAVAWVWQAFFPKSTIFPPFMTELSGVFFCIAAVCLVRLWIAIYQRSLAGRVQKPF